MKVCLDAGHGGRDPGAVTPPLVEKRLNMELLDVIGNYLRRAGHEVCFTRTEDVYVPNRKRARIAKEWGAKVFISIHHNSHYFPSANGFEVLYYPTSTKGKRLATAICMTVTGRWPIRNRGPKPRKNLIVLYATRMPAILIEAGFVSSTIDRRDSLLDRNKRAKFYRVIAKTVVEVIISL